MKFKDLPWTNLDTLSLTWSIANRMRTTRFKPADKEEHILGWNQIRFLSDNCRLTFSSFLRLASHLAIGVDGFRYSSNGALVLSSCDTHIEIIAIQLKMFTFDSFTLLFGFFQILNQKYAFFLFFQRICSLIQFCPHEQ